MLIEPIKAPITSRQTEVASSVKMLRPVSDPGLTPFVARA